MLPTPLTSVWSSSARLSPVRRRRSAATQAVVVEVRVERVAGDVRDRRRDAVDQVDHGASPPKVRWSTKRSSGPPSVKASRTRRCVSSGRPAGRTSSWPLMPRWASTRVVGRPSQRQPQVLAAAAGAGRRVRPASRAAKSAPPAGVPADGPGVGDLDGGDRAAGDPAVEAAADHLDLGQLGHRAGRSGLRPGRPSAPASSGQLGPQVPPGGGRGLLLGLLLAAAAALAVRPRRRPGRRR